MSIVNIQALKQLGNVLWWPGQSAVSGAYDDDGNKRGFLILPDGVTVTPNGTFTTQKMKDGRNIWKFDGSTNYILISNNNAFNFGTGNFTICCWAKTNSLSATNAIFGNGDASATYATRSITIAINVTNGYFFVYLWDSSTTQINVLSTYALSINTWYHLTFIREGNLGYLYVNNALVYSSAVTGSLQFPDSSWGIGSVGLFPSVRMNGNIKDLMIFKGKALTQDQIAAIMAETYIY